jgi:hypothetical protein
MAVDAVAGQLAGEDATKCDPEQERPRRGGVWGHAPGAVLPYGSWG